MDTVQGPHSPAFPEPLEDTAELLATDTPSAVAQSTRIMLTTAAHFVQQHLHDQLAELGLTPLGLSVLSGLEEVEQATVEELAKCCLLPEATVRITLQELLGSGLIDREDGLYRLTPSGKSALAESHELEETLFAEKSTTLRLELGALIERLRQSGALPE